MLNQFRRSGVRKPSRVAVVGARHVAVEPLERRRLLAASISVTNFSGGVEIPDGDASPSIDEGTDFGATPVATARPFRSFQVTNTSTADDLTLGGLTAPAGFKIEQSLPDVLGPGASAFFTVSMLDDAQETRTGAVQFNTNVPGAEVFDFTVSGSVVSAAPDPSNIFEDVPSFSHFDSVSFQGGLDPDGQPVSLPVSRLLRFNVPAGEAQAGFTLGAASAISEGATADVQLLVIRDADADGELDLAELASPETGVVAPPDTGEQVKTVTLPAATYFALLRPANIKITDESLEQPGVRVDYALEVSISALAGPDVEVTFGESDVPDDDTSPSPDEGTQFGAVQVGQAAPTRTFRITNTGGGTLELGAVTVSGPFRIVSGPAVTSLATAASTDIVVAMDTAAVGDKAGGVSIVTNVGARNPYNFAVAGTVTENPPPAVPEVSVLLDGGAALADGQAAAVDFGSSVQGRPGASRTFVVRNDGNAPLTLGTVSLPAGFTLTDPLVGSLAAGASDRFVVLLSTDTSGERAGSISIPTNDANENPFNFPVRGVVAQPASTPGADIAVLLDDAPLAPDGTIDFGTATAGQAAPERTLTIRNDGFDELTLGQVTLPPGYTLAQGPEPVNLAPGESTTIRVALDTQTAGTFAGQATIPSNDADENPFTLNLTGTVAQDQPAVPAPIQVSNVTGKVPPVVVAGDRRARGAVAFTVTNNTGAAFRGPVTFAAYASADNAQGPADAQLVTVTKNMKFKAAGASRTMRLKFKFPQAVTEGQKVVLVTADPVNALPVVQTSTAVGPPVNVQAPFVRLTGLPAAAPAPRPLTFGRPARFAVPLQNAGNVPTSRTPATYTVIVSRDATEAGQVFQTTATGRINLKPAASRPQKLTVTFPPGAFPAGSYTAIVRLTAELNQTNGETVALIPFTIA